MRIIIYILFGCISLAYIGSAWTDLDYMLSILTSLYFPVCLIYFLREKVDIFEKETWADLLLVFMISCIITFLFGFILTFRDSVFTTLHTDNPSFVDMLLGVAFLEEIVKIIPVLIILKLMKSINEPIDYLIYASISALGFAFLENIDYIYLYKEDLVHIVGVRSFMSTLLHVYTTSIIGIGLYYFQSEVNKLRRYMSLIGLFIIAILLHTIWNLYGGFGIQYYGLDITVCSIILVLGSGSYGEAIRELLMASPFFNFEKIPTKEGDDKSLHHGCLLSIMIFGVFIIDFIFEYIQSQSYNMDLIFQCVIICMGFFGFFIGPLNKEYVENEKKRVAIWEKYNQLEEFGDKLSDEKRSPIEEAFTEWRKTIDGPWHAGRSEAIDSAMEKLTTLLDSTTREIMDTNMTKDKIANSENTDSNDTPSDDVTDVKFEE